MLKRRLVTPLRTTEDGAILIMTAVLLIVLVGFAALAVDLGNAWSNDTKSQSSADVAAMGGLQSIPYTFGSGAGAPAPTVQSAVDAEINDLMALNEPDATAAGVVDLANLDLTVDVTLDSPNSFGRAIGGGNATTVGATATGHIEIGKTDKLLPVGFYEPSTQPYQCMQASIPDPTDPGNDFTPRVCRDPSPEANGSLNVLLEMFQLDPPSCAAVTVSNFANGVDHLVDMIDTGARSEADACAAGHILTMPSVAATLTPTTAILDAGPGPLASGAPLWEYLRPTLQGSCSPSNYDASVELEEKTLNMRSCLKSYSGGRLFTSGLTSSPRFGHALRIADGSGGVEFAEPILLFVNTVISDSIPPDDPLTAQFVNYPPASGNVGAVTMYSLEAGMLSASDENALELPVGIDVLEYELTN